MTTKITEEEAKAIQEEIKAVEAKILEKIKKRCEELQTDTEFMKELEEIYGKGYDPNTKEQDNGKS